MGVVSHPPQNENNMGTVRKNYYYYTPRGFANEYEVFFAYENDSRDAKTIDKVKDLAYRFADKNNQLSSYRFERISADEARSYTKKSVYGSDEIRHIKELYRDLIDEFGPEERY